MDDAGSAPVQFRAAQDGLRRLAALVRDLLNEALPSPVTPAFAGLPSAGALPPGMAMTAGTSAPSGTAHRPRMARAGRPSPAGRSSTAGSDGPEADEQPDDGGAEVWALIRRAQDGDGEAFGQLYDRYVDTVFRFIYYRVNDRGLAEDFTSETFLRALRRIGTFTYQGRDLAAWLLTIARNIVLDHVKSARNRLEQTTAEHPEPREHVASTETAVLANLQSETLIAAIKQLGDEQRQCVTLRFIQGLSVSETAAAMGKNDGAIKALQHRAVRRLADLIGGDLR